MPTNAVFGFTAMLRSCCASSGRITWRWRSTCPADVPARLFEEYKATREKPPDEFLAQIPLAREVLEALRIPVYAKEGYEADDVLGRWPSGPPARAWRSSS